MDIVQVPERALYTRVGAFSGGNQQKIAIGKWLLAGSRVMLMYDPTRGVDVGTKHEIYLLIHEFAEAAARRCCSPRRSRTGESVPPRPGDVRRTHGACDSRSTT